MLRKKKYVKLEFKQIQMESTSPILSGSVVDNNNTIKAASQEVVEVNLEDDTVFEINWE